MTSITQKSFAFFVDRFYYIDETKVTSGYITTTWLNSFLDSIGGTDNNTDTQTNSNPA
jgi:hypothetical protein